MSQLSHDPSVVVSATGVSFGSVCSGIEAASVAWEPMGWKAAWFAEIEAFPSAVLAHHWPQVQNLGDMTKIRDRITAGEIQAPDVLVGGTPCQAFSVAGARKSLDDDRGQLSLEYIKLANSIDEKRNEKNEQPAVIVWENVPGVLNTKDNAFGCFLGALAGESDQLLAPGGRWSNAGVVFGPQRAIAWRILDAQYFGVAQRRRRVFVVASARKGFNPAKVLFEWEGVRRDSPPSRMSREDATGSSSQGFAESSFAQFRPTDGDCETLKRSGGVLGGGSETFVIDTPTYAYGGDLCATVTSKWGKGSGGPAGNECGNLVIHANDNATTSSNYTLFEPRSADGVPRFPPDQTLCPTLNTMSGGQREPCVALRGMVRRLTPVECERLQGFPDNHTQIPYRNKSADLCPDGPRYAACGNSMAVPVMAWIGKRIEDALNELKTNDNRKTPATANS